MSDPNIPNNPNPQPTPPPPQQGVPGGDPGQMRPAPPKSGGSAKWIFAILGILLLTTVCVCGGAVFMLNQAVQGVKNVAVDAFHEEFVTQIQQSSLSGTQQTALISEVDGLRDDIKSGEIGLEQIGALLEELGTSPIMSMLMMEAVDGMYITPSGLLDEEKDAARLTVQRIARGVHDGDISKAQVQQLVQPLQQTNPDGSTQLRDTITDEELSALLVDAEALADGAGVSSEPYEPDYAKILRDSIQKAKDRTAE